MLLLTTNEILSDEVTSINSIYDPETLTPTSADSTIFRLGLPSLPSITLRIEFPTDYPNAPPSILGTQSVGDDVPKGVGNKVVDIVREVLADIYTPGEECIFALLEEVREALEKAEEAGTLHLQPQSQHNADIQNPHGENFNSHSNEAKEKEKDATEEQAHADLGPPPPWLIAPPITEKKSVFLARIAPVSSPALAKSYVAHLLATDKKAARATHNITAWRIRGTGETTYQDCDDDGETAAGGRLLHLMQLMDVWDVMVVVTRWYGGVLLGPDRFRIINSAAREALGLGGYGKEAVEGKKKGKR